jgi:hypothetical protein
MSEVLTITRCSLDASLAIPGALFSPSELQIGPSTTQGEFVRIGRAISAIGDADSLWECDYALWGMRKFGTDDGLNLAASATGLSKFFLKRCARIAERFTPERRYPTLNRNHYRILLPFDQAQIDEWLPTVADQKRLSAKSLRALAVAEFGEPVKTKQPQKHTIQIRETTWTRLAQQAPSRKTVVLVELILNAWLKRPQDEQAIILAAAELQKAQKREASQKRRTGKPKAEKIKEPASLDFQLKKFKREHPEWSGGCSLGETEAKGNKNAAATSQPKAGKQRKKEILWKSCKGMNGEAIGGASYTSLDAAHAADERFYAYYARHARVEACELCNLYHLYADPQKKSAPSGAVVS